MTALPCIEVYGTPVRISRVGFGCARLFDGVERRASARLIEAALECGIRHFDTAPSYGDGGSEQVLGEVLRGMSEVTLTTKIGIPRPDRPSESWRGRWYRRFLRPALAHAPSLKRRLLALAAGRVDGSGLSRDAAAPVPRRIDPAAVARELEISLSLLRRDAIDLYMIHEPECLVIDADLLAAFAALRRQGLIRGFGYAFGGRASAWPEGIDVVQSQYPPKGELALPVTVAQAPTRIFHGVMRPPKGELVGSLAVGGPQALADALRRYPCAAILFSASTPRQIREVVSMIQGEGALCGS